jgi:uncharacterized coiled-coil protein SlyX
MIATKVEINRKVDELWTILDKDVRHIEESLFWLNELRSLIIKRDDVLLGELLKRIQSAMDSYNANELRRQLVREELAQDLGCALKEVTLSRLEKLLPEEKRAQLSQRKDKLRLLTGKLKKEHLNTMLLLSDCARFNSLLLRSILEPLRSSTITYDCGGSTKRDTETAFVNVKF